jgi:nucleoside-diphosphate-sugar epimerase
MFQVSWIISYILPHQQVLSIIKNSNHKQKMGSLGTHNLLGLARKARILIASTSEVYGDP